MSAVRPELFGAAQVVLDYLGFAASDRLLITTDTAGDQAVVGALAAAALAAHGRPIVLSMPQAALSGQARRSLLARPARGRGAARRSVDRPDLSLHRRRRAA
ncbi:MAG: hypothetical protein WDO24_24955 [Pseudomonadota bacterium]